MPCSLERLAYFEMDWIANLKNWLSSCARVRRGSHVRLNSLAHISGANDKRYKPHIHRHMQTTEAVQTAQSRLMCNASSYMACIHGNRMQHKHPDLILHAGVWRVGAYGMFRSVRCHSARLRVLLARHPTTWCIAEKMIRKRRPGM
jgi:hypothetical protein